MKQILIFQKQALVKYIFFFLLIAQGSLFACHAQLHICLKCFEEICMQFSDVTDLFEYAACKHHL